MPTPRQIADEWDRAAPTRERQIATGKDHSAIHVLAPAILQAAAQCDVSRVLDVGCGTGWLTVLIAHNAAEVLGVDPSGVSIEIARKHHNAANVRYEEATVESLAERMPNTFTLAFANMTLSTSPNLSLALGAVSALLKPRRRFLFTIPHPCFFPTYWHYANEPWFEYGSEIAISERFHILAETSDFQTTHVHRPLERYVSELSAAGFRIIGACELTGNGFHLPRFLLINAEKAG